MVVVLAIVSPQTWRTSVKKQKQKKHTGITTLLRSTSTSSNTTLDVLLAQGLVVIKITGTTILTQAGRGHGWWVLEC